MLLALWLAITWLLYGFRVGYDESQPNRVSPTYHSSCPYVCGMADSIMMNIFETNLPINSSGELHARCAVTRFLTDECWNQEKFGSYCLPQRTDLQNQTETFWEDYCKMSENDSYQKPCFRQWSHRGNLCPGEYMRLVSHLVEKKAIDLNVHNGVSICCDFVQFLECAKKDTGDVCSSQIEDVVRRFFFKLAGQKALDYCLALRHHSSFRSRCRN